MTGIWSSDPTAGSRGITVGGTCPLFGQADGPRRCSALESSSRRSVDIGDLWKTLSWVLRSTLLLVGGRLLACSDRPWCIGSAGMACAWRALR
jgi:hypothetical protein